MKKKVLTVLCAAMVAASCFAVQTGTASAAHKHSYSCTVIRPVLCDVNGINRYTCSCGEAYEKQVPMPGHKYSETVLKDPSCISKGTVRKTCTVCGSTFTGSIPKAAHQYVTSGSITKCRTCGKEVSSGSVSESRTPETKPSQPAVKPAQPAKPGTPAKPVDTRTSSEKARQAAVDWAIKIAGDNSFHYGRSSWAHHNGCYFCGTNQKAGSLKRRAGASKAACEKTYCCNPFVTAAYKHGAGAKEVDCKVRGKRFGLANDNNKVLKNTKAFKRISKPKKITSLEPGDILLSPTHAMLYAGGGKVVEAAHHDNGKRDSCWNDSIRCKKISSGQWKRVTKIYRYIGKGKF